MFNSGFYPTPAHIAHKMLAKLKGSPERFLEPSAGKGDIAEAIKHSHRYSRATVDCIEVHPDLQAILTKQGHTLVGSDWLTYDGVAYHDAILMNPPFDDGDTHLLKAWDYLYDGQIVCLLNTETLRNPFSAERRRLVKIIAEHGHVEELGTCFKSAERPTGVDVAMVYLRKANVEDALGVFGTSEEERAANSDAPANQDLVILDRIGNMQDWYEGANVEMLKAIQHLRRAHQFMAANGINAGKLIEQVAAEATTNPVKARGLFLQAHRKQAWASVLHQTEFARILDHKQRQAMQKEIESGGHFPFTAGNIRSTLENIFEQRQRMFEQSVANVFDELTNFYKGNTNHVEGWKSNSGYKVNEKIVFPYGCSYDKDFGGRFASYYSERSCTVYDDIDRVLCVLSAKSFDECVTVRKALGRAFDQFRLDGTTKCESDHFKITFYKKGTVHLVWRDPVMRQAFNVTAAKGKAWLGMDHREAA